MSSRDRFNLSNSRDLEIVLVLLEEENENWDTNDEFGIYSNDEEGVVKEREECTDTEQEGVSNDSDKEIIEDSYFLGRDKKSKWGKVGSPKNSHTHRQNIVTHLPGVLVSAKLAKSYKDCWQCFFDNNMLSTTVYCTKKKISEIQTNYNCEGDAQPRDVIEIKALFGILYVLKFKVVSYAEFWIMT